MGKPFSKEYSHINSQSQTSIHQFYYGIEKYIKRSKCILYYWCFVCDERTEGSTRNRINSFTHASVIFLLLTNTHTHTTEKEASRILLQALAKAHNYMQIAKPNKQRHQRDKKSKQNSAKQKKNFILLFCFGQ